jgi:hypothetical protein
MKRLTCITPFLIVLLLSMALAQSRPYAKYNGTGETIGLFNLSNNSLVCSDRRAITGTVSGFRFRASDTEFEYNFALDTGGRRRFVGFRLDRDAIPQKDVENLLINNRRFRITVDGCLNSGIWNAEKIIRQEKAK